jgi:hypothetical protein
MFLIVSAIALLFLAPGYWIFAIAMYVVIAFLSYHQTISNGLAFDLAIILASLGWLRVCYKFWHRRASDIAPSPAPSPVDNASSQQAWEEPFKGETEWNREQVRKRQEERKLQQEERKLEEEYKRAQTDNKELPDKVAALISSCGPQAAEMMRAAKALHGLDIVPTERLVQTDISQILVRIAEASGLGVEAVTGLYFGIQLRIDPDSLRDYTLLDARNNLRDVDTSGALAKQSVVLLVAAYDQMQGTHLASIVAQAYLSVVAAATTRCGTSLAVKMVADAYDALLRPYIFEKSRAENTGHASTASGGPTERSAACEHCVRSYRILALPLNSSPDAVRLKRRTFAEFLHPDQLGSKTEQARRAAEEQLKNVNEACDHILSCRAAH